MIAAKQAIRFFFNDVAFDLRDRKKLKRFMLSIFKSEKKKVENLTYIFSTNRIITALNKKFLNHNYQTDILTFSITNNPLQAEIYISIEKIRENSILYNCTFKEELLRVMFHGILHLCGYDDNSSKQKKEMRKKEDYYLKLYERFT